MTEWTSTRLGDVLELQRGFDITKKQQRPGDIPVVSSSGIGSFHDVAKCDGPGVVVGRKGSLGTVFFVPSPYWPHDTTLWVRDFKGNDPAFCYLLLKTLRLQDLDAGASNPTLNRNHAHLLPVVVPPATVQRRIAEVVFAFGDLIECNRRQIEILEEAARSLYDEWFVRFRFPGHDSVGLVDSRVGRIPQLWEPSSLGKHVDFVMGQSPSSTHYNESGDGLAFHQGVGSYGRRYPVHRRWTREWTREAGASDILVSVRAPVGRLNVADRRMALGRGLAAARARDGLQSFWFEALRRVFQQEDAFGGGTIFRAVTRSDLDEIDLVIPPASLRRRFDAAVAPLHELDWALDEANRRLTDARDLSVPKLVSGRIDVDSLDVDGVFGWAEVVQSA